MMNILEQLYWREPWWLLLSLFPVIRIVWQRRQQRFSLSLYADKELLPWVSVPGLQKQRYFQQVMQVFIWLLFAIAAAGPRFLLSVPPELLPPQGAMVIVIDQSRSMQANDVFPNRLQQAHNIVRQWVQTKDEIKKGLVIFAGAAHIVLPVTSDKKVLNETVFLLDKIQMPTHGSAMVNAVLQAKSLLSKDSKERAIFLLTDGDVPAEKFKQLQQVIEQLQQENIFLHLFGVGKPFPVALTDSFGHWLQYNGKTVFTQLKDDALRALAENKNVYYHRLDFDVYAQLSDTWQPQGARIAAQDYDQVLWHELFPWFLMSALLLIILNRLAIPMCLMSERLLPKSIVKLGAFFIISVFISVTAEPAQAAEKMAKKATIQSAYEIWKNKDYETAADYYAALKGYAARMGEGASCFRSKQIECAIKAFSLAAWQAKTDEQHGQASFNLGNSFFKQGDFKSAITLYRDALRYQPEQAVYINNLQFSEEVQRNIERRLQQETTSLETTPRTRGWKTIDSNNELVANTNITLAEIKDQQGKIGTIKISKERLALYMFRSQNFARLSEGKAAVKKRQYDWQRFSNEEPVAARKVEYWQRLFELEEGIPAHHDEPDVLPGVRPW